MTANGMNTGSTTNAMSRYAHSATWPIPRGTWPWSHSQTRASMNWWAPSSTGIHAIAMNSRRCRIWRTASTPIAHITKPPPISASGEKHI
jgi:hypothetical protein